MSVINTNVGNSGYYQLNGSSGGAVGTQVSAASLASSLLQDSGSNNLSSYSAAYLLDLSPEAQQYLAASQQTQTSGSLLSGQQQFVLSNAQRQQITDILAKYRDEPFTQETYNKIQDELEQAGLSGRKLAMIEKATSFNPTQMLINALTGKATSASEADLDGTQSQARIDKYMQQIVGQWQAISTTVNAPADTSDATEEAAADSDAVRAAGSASEG